MMKTFEWNKFFMAFLSIALFTMLVMWFTEEVYHPHEVEVAGYPIEVASAGPVEAAVVDAGPSLAELLQTASADQGAKVFKKCAACHNAAQGGANGTGPNLWNTVDEDIADAGDFRYSTEMAGLEGNWTPETLDAFLTKPAKWLPGTKMSFAGLKKASDRARVIKYLWANGDQSDPLPEALPAPQDVADAS